MPSNAKDSNPQILYVEEFSLPPYFFDKDFLDNADLREPHVKERKHPENNLLPKRIGLPEKAQEYRYCPQVPVTAQK